MNKTTKAYWDILPRAKELPSEVGIELFGGFAKNFREQEKIIQPAEQEME